MKFFELLQEKGGVDMSIRIMQKNDTLTLMISPGSLHSTTGNINLSGSGAQLDELFMEQVFPVVQRITELRHNLAEAEKEAAAAKDAGKKVEKKEEPKKQPAKKAPAPKKETGDLFEAASTSSTSGTPGTPGTSGTSSTSTDDPTAETDD